MTNMDSLLLELFSLKQVTRGNKQLINKILNMPLKKDHITMVCEDFDTSICRLCSHIVSTKLYTYIVDNKDVYGNISKEEWEAHFYSYLDKHILPKIKNITTTDKLKEGIKNGG